MKRIVGASSILGLALFVAAFAGVEAVEAKCRSKKPKMNMESMEKMDHQPGMCCSMDHEMDMNEEKDSSKDAPMDHSKMENSSAESDRQVAMAGMEKEKKPGKQPKSDPNLKKVKDPVCGMEVDPKSAAAKATYKDKTYYFCSVAEKEQFEKAPEKYVK
jgi:YHS domain-containing protein